MKYIAIFDLPDGNPSALGKNKIQWITNQPAGLRGRAFERRNKA